MAFYHVQSSDFNKLLDDFIKNVEENSNLFDPPLILTAGPEIRKWLQLTLADRLEVCLNLPIVLLEKGIVDFLKELTAHNSHVPLFTDEDSLLLSHVVFEVLKEKETEPILANYLKNFPNDIKDYNLWQLAHLLNSLFREAEYHIDNITSPQFSSLFSTKDKISSFIFEVYEKSREKLREKETLTLKIWKEQVVSLAKKDPNQEYPPLFLWSFLVISPLHFQFLELISQFRDVYFYSFLLPPHNLFKEGISVQDKNTLRIEQLIPHAENRFLDMPSNLTILKKLEKLNNPKKDQKENKNILKSLQYHLKNPQETFKPFLYSDTFSDKSLQIKGAQGIFREAESLCLELTKTFKENPNWKFSDVAVVIPKPEEYQIPLRAFLENGAFFLPHQWIDIAIWQESMWAKGCKAFLQLLKPHKTRMDIIHFLSHPYFLASLNIAEKTSLTFSDLAKNLGAYYFEENFSFSQASQRVLAGKIMQGQGFDFETQQAQEFLGILPYQSFLDEEQVDSFALAFLVCQEKINILLKTLKESPWEDFLQQVEEVLKEILPVPFFTNKEEATQEEKIAQDFFLRLDGLKKLSFASYTPDFVVGLLIQGLSALKSPRKKFLTSGGMPIGSPDSLRGIPFKAIFWLGLNEESFPGYPGYSSLSLMKSLQEPQKDEYWYQVENYKIQHAMFLESILMAEEKIGFFYQDFDPFEQASLYPSSVLRTLARFIFKDSENCFLGPALNALKAGTYKPDLYSRLWLKDEDLEGYFDWLHQEEGKVVAKETPLGSLAPSFHNQEKPIEVSLKDLTRFLEDPLNCFLNKHMGYQKKVEELEDFEPFAMKYQTKESLKIFEEAIKNNGLEENIKEESNLFKNYHQFLQKQQQKPQNNSGIYDAWKLENETLLKMGLVEKEGIVLDGFKVFSLEKEGKENSFSLSLKGKNVVFKGEFSFVKEEEGHVALLSFSYGDEPKIKHFIEPFVLACLIKCYYAIYEKLDVSIDIYLLANQVKKAPFSLDVDSCFQFLEKLLEDFFDPSLQLHYMPLEVIPAKKDFDAILDYPNKKEEEERQREEERKREEEKKQEAKEKDSQFQEKPLPKEKKKNEVITPSVFYDKMIKEIEGKFNSSYGGYKPPLILKLMPQVLDKVPQNIMEIFYQRHSSLIKEWLKLK